MAAFIAHLLQGAALGITAAATPGPFQAYLINQTLSTGWQRAVPIAFAPLISDLPIIIVMLVILDQLPQTFLKVISVCGGVFVLYLALGFWKQWRGERQKVEIQEPGPGGVLRKGVLMNLLSPGPYTFWGLVNGPILLAALRNSVWVGIAFLAGFYFILVGGFIATVFLFDQSRRLGPRVVRILTFGSIVILVAFGIILLFDGISGLLDTTRISQYISGYGYG